MPCPKRLLALAGCAMIAIACTQETTTAPEPVAEVGTEAMPPTYGTDEGGTVTLVRDRNAIGGCLFKVAFTGLYDAAANTADGYYLLLEGGSYQSTRMEASKRGTYRGTLTQVWPNQWHSASNLVLSYGAGGGFLSRTVIADLSSGVITTLYPNFKVVNRCF